MQTTADYSADFDFLAVETGQFSLTPPHSPRVQPLSLDEKIAQIHHGFYANYMVVLLPTGSHPSDPWTYPILALQWQEDRLAVGVPSVQNLGDLQVAFFRINSDDQWEELTATSDLSADWELILVGGEPQWICQDWEQSMYGGMCDILVRRHALKTVYLDRRTVEELLSSRRVLLLEKKK